MAAVEVNGECLEDSPAINMGYVVGPAGAALDQADVSSITYAVFDREKGKQITSGSLTVADVIFDTLQTPAIWTRDTTGYNFRHDAGPATMPEASRWYRFEYKITLTSGAIGWAVFNVYVKPLWTS